MMRTNLSSHVAFLLVCGALWSCGTKRGLVVGDGGRADLGVEIGLMTDSAPPGPDAGPDLNPADVPVDQASGAADGVVADVVADSVVADVVADRASDPRGPSVSEALGETSADRDLPADLRPATLDQGAHSETAGPVTATPSGGCVPGIITPSLAYRGVVGIDFDEDGIADEVDRCPVLATSSQLDSDGDGLGNACDQCSGGADGDKDGLCDSSDNCPVDWNPAQYDIDGDGVGDHCDSQRCYFSAGTADAQRILQRLLRKPEFTAPLADAHWRLMSTRTYCRNSAVAVDLQILDYRQRKLLTVGYLVESDQIVSLVVADLTDLQGPQPSAEEGREAAYLAERDPRVGPILDGLRNRISSGVFFYEFGTQPGNNDPAFPTCATGRCIDILYSGSPPDGAYVNYSVVVEMDACQVLGITTRP